MVHSFIYDICYLLVFIFIYHIENKYKISGNKEIFEFNSKENKNLRVPCNILQLETSLIRGKFVKFKSSKFILILFDVSKLLNQKQIFCMSYFSYFKIFAALKQMFHFDK